MAGVIAGFGVIEVNQILIVAFSPGLAVGESALST